VEYSDNKYISYGMVPKLEDGFKFKKIGKIINILALELTNDSS
jgi:hypothetical protein